MSEFSERLRGLRKTRGFTVKETASKIGVPMTTYREWEFGRAIQGQPYMAMAEVLGVTLSELMTGDETDDVFKNCLRELRDVEQRIQEIQSKLRSHL